MDHLPKIANSKQDTVVQCLCIIDRSFKPYAIGYPESKGWRIVRGQEINRLDGSAAIPAEIAAFIQEWLFFGVLAEVLEIAGLNVNFGHFVRRATIEESRFSDFVVTTLTLRHYLDKWEELEQNADVARRRERQTLILPVLSLVEEFFINHLDYTRSPVSLNLDVLLSILILAETLKHAAMYIWRLPIREYPLRAVGFHRRHNLLKDRLLKAGRCISEAAMLHDLLDNTGLYIAASIPWPTTCLQRSHDACTTLECVAYQVNDTEYQTAHAEDCVDPNSCSFVPVDEQKLALVLRDDKIPVIKVKIGDQMPYNVELEVASDEPFVAISHVWGHGLGNVNCNALPRCQILRLIRLTSELWHLEHDKSDENPHIWIDTLCIPRSPTFSEYRKMAIIKLAETFSHATKVLALDAELCQTSVECFRAEFATRVLCSGWMRRLWTLQEAVMTEKLGSPGCRKLCMQIREGPVALNSLLDTGLYTLYYSEKALQSVFSRFPQHNDTIDNFSTLSHALEYRTTTKPTDEAICLTSILGLDIRPVVEAGDSAETRMCAFYKQISSFPSEILFHRGQRLGSDGFRWAPSSFLSSGSSKSAIFRLDYNKTCNRDDNGLHGRFPGYLITGVKPPKSNGDHFHFVDPDDPQTLWRLVPEKSSIDFLASRENWIQEQKRRSAFDDMVSGSEIVGLIMDPNSNLSDVVLLRINDTYGLGDHEENEVRGRYMCRVSLYSVPTKEKTREELESREGIRVNAKKLSNMQRWCVF